MKKKWPVLRSDEEAERINMHLPVDLLAAVKAGPGRAACPISDSSARCWSARCGRRGVR